VKPSLRKINRKPAPRAALWRPYVERLEDRWLPGDTILGGLLGQAVLTSGFGVVNSSSVQGAGNALAQGATSPAGRPTDARNLALLTTPRMSPENGTGAALLIGAATALPTQGADARNAPAPSCTANASLTSRALADPLTSVLVVDPLAASDPFAPLGPVQPIRSGGASLSEPYPTGRNDGSEACAVETPPASLASESSIPPSGSGLLAVANASGPILPTGFVHAGGGGTPPVTCTVAMSSNVTLSPKEGNGFDTAVAYFTASDPSCQASALMADINWGNGQDQGGSIIDLGNGNFSVDGSSVYKEEGSYKITVVITDQGPPTTVNSSANVTDALLHWYPADPPSFDWEMTQLTDPGPSFSATGNQVNAEGNSVLLQLVASDSDGDSLSFGAVGLPPGLSISSSGLISGTVG
jgi:hypothetical protein